MFPHLGKEAGPHFLLLLAVNYYSCVGVATTARTATADPDWLKSTTEVCPEVTATFCSVVT